MAKRFSKIAILLMLVLALLVPMMVMSVGAEDNVVATFELGANGDATHADGSKNLATYSETVGNYTLSITGTNMYPYSYDAKGNSCIKFGASSKAGTFTFDVPADVTSVILHVAKYKANTTKLTVNGTSYTLTKNSNDGEYDVITVDTSSTKTVTFTTVSGGYRAMLNTIEFLVEGSDSDEPENPVCKHTETREVITTDPAHGVEGSANIVCNACEKVVDTKVLPAHWTATFNVPAGATAPEIDDASSITLPEAVDAPSNYDKYQYTFVGWALAEVTNSADKPTIYKAGDTYALTADTAFYAVYSYGFGSVSNDYELKDLSEIKSGDSVVVTMTTATGTVYALPNNGGTSSSHEAIIINVSDNKLPSEPAETLVWQFESLESGFSLYTEDPDNNTTHYLYCTNSNTGIRVGTNANKVFVVDESSGYIKNVATNRYVGVYTTNPDWRCYTNTTGNTANQTLRLYVKSTGSFYYTTSLEVAPKCEHTNTTTTTVDAKCNIAGSTTVTCDDCDTILSTVTIPATGHLNTTTTTINATCTEDGSVTVTCDDCGTTISSETIKATGHNYVDKVCTVCGDIEVNYSGRYYIATIRTEGNYWYMTSDLGDGSTKRYQAVDTGLTELPVHKVAEVGYVFVIVKNDDNTTYSIYAEGVEGDNYLGWTSGNSGTLVAAEFALKFTIDVTDGLYNILFAASDGERYLSLNGTAGSDYFAFYKGTQKQDLALIPVVEAHTPGAPADCENDQVCTVCGEVLVEKLGHTEVVDEAVAPTCTTTGLTEGKHCSVCSVVLVAQTEVPATGHDHEAVVTAPTCTEAGFTTYTCSCGDTYTEAGDPATGHSYVDGKCECGAFDPAFDHITGAALYIGKDLSVLYTVATTGNLSEYTMKFTFNGEEIVVNATEIEGNYYFVLAAVSPDLMGENIKAELFRAGTEEAVATMEEYSVVEYCKYFLDSGSAELKELLANLLAYGAAAQQYKSETELGAEDLVNNGVTGAKEYECTENVKAVTGDAAIIAGAGVSFGVDNKVYFRLVENYEEMFGAVTVKINGEDAEIVGGYIYTEGVKATELSTEFTLVISVGETVIKTAKYSITSYVTIIGAGTSEGAALARALYNYGCSAKNYMGV